MNSFLVEFIEVKKDLLFVAGTTLSPLKLGDNFSLLYQIGKNTTSKQKKADVTLKIHAILLNGEALESIAAKQAPMLILEGDAQAVMDAAEALQWRKKDGRFFRTTDLALSLESDET